jgi:hypothetical protein
LPQIVFTGGPFAGLLGSVQSREQECRQYPDDRNDDQQFNEGKGAPKFHRFQQLVLLR